MADRERLRRLVLRLKPGESLLVTIVTGHSLVIRRDSSAPNKFMFEELTAPEGEPHFVVRRNADPIAEGQLFDGGLQRKRDLHRLDRDVSGAGI